MLKKELFRIACLALVGLVLGFLFLDEGVFQAVAPFYMIGIAYAAPALVRAACRLFRHWQVMNLFTRSLLGSILALTFLLSGLFFLVVTGWVLGLIRCTIAFLRAARLDRRLPLP